MKINIKHIILFIIMLLPLSVKADKIYNVNMDVKIDNLGNAHVEEIWEVKATTGTEWYKAYDNLGNINLSNFVVYQDGERLIKKDYWDINATKEEKAGHYGINNTSTGIELCFGKDDYNTRHIFTLSYDLSNMIFNTEDSQILYFTFLPKVKLDSYNINISSFYYFPDTLDVWGYGAKGYAYVENGTIKMSNEGKVKDNYVTLLVKFPINTFNTKNKYIQFNTFNDVYNKAEEGTYDYNYNSVSFLDTIYNIFSFLMSFLPFIIIVVSIIALNKSKYGYKDNKTINAKNTPLFREIPCNKDIYYANALIKLNEFNYKNTNILGAIILKWVKEDRIRFINDESGKFNKNTAKIDMTLNVAFNEQDNRYEKDLFEAMYKASEDGFLETKELEKWAKKNYSKFFKLVDNFSNSEIIKLKDNNHIYKRKSKSECKYNNVMDDMIYEDSSKLYGLKLFFNEFTRMDTKEVMDVKLWDEYLMFAYLFGVADKVCKQLKNLYPEVLLEMQENNANMDFNTLLFINSISSRSASAATSARSAASSYSSGGGGFSSGGGGGGSFGGGGSMGGR